MFGWFRKPKPAVRFAPPSKEAWGAGDLAACVADRWHDQSTDDPRVGDVLRVTKVFIDRDPAGTRKPYLTFVGKSLAYEAGAFRKIVISHEPAEAEFTALIKRPARVGEPA